MSNDRILKPIHRIAKRLEFADFLDHPEQWPQGFVWDYTSGDKCAMPLGRRCGFADSGGHLASALNINYPNPFISIFVKLHEQLGIKPEQVTASHVATALRNIPDNC